MDGTQVPIWAMMMIAGGSAFFGAMVGAFSSALLELWRQIVSGLAASRVIRSELTENMTIAGVALDRAEDHNRETHGLEVRFRDQAWLQLRTAVAPLLDASALTYVAAIYSFMPQSQRFADILISTGPDVTSSANLKTWQRNLNLASMHLIEMEASGRHILFWRLLRPQRVEIPSLEEGEKWGDALDRYEAMKDVK